MARGETLMNALVGAVVTIVLSFLPFSSVLGGGVAGYLQREEGATVGAISGLIALLPLVVLFTVVFGVFSIGMMGMAPRGMLFFGGALWIAFVFMAVYTVGLSAIGGIVGVHVATETEIGS